MPRSTVMPRTVTSGRQRDGDAAPQAAAAAGSGAPAAPRETDLREVVEHLGGSLADAGLARLPARVFAALMATEDGRLTSAELAALLEVSPAGVSGAVRYLTQVRMIRRERQRGSRREVYVVMDDAWHDVLVQRDQLYGPILAALVEAHAVLGPGSRAGERMQLSVEFLEFVTREMGGIAQRWEEYKAARGEAGGREQEAVRRGTASG